MFFTNKQSGFTLIEMIVSLALFSTVITVSVGALLTLIATNQDLQNEQTVMTNLSFALDSMTRELRTGTNYYCDAQNSKNSGSSGEKIFRDGDALDFDPVQDCTSGNSNSRTYQGISFIEGGKSITKIANTRIVYFYDSTDGKIYRRISGQNAQPITSSDIYIQKAEFFVSGSKPQSAGGAGINDQAVITVYIEAREIDGTEKDPYKMQTTVTQRTLDI
ncbi:type II secretion system protein [Candidatus Kaiserbacteria bacterium]|nr:type II secretion system protein [Candidatus Kaiserbacteria bacterium]